MRTAVFVALVLCLIAGVVLSVAPEEVANRLKKGESRCIDRCVKRAKLPSKVPTCMDFCAKLVTKEKFLKKVVNQIAAEEEEAAESTPESVLSDQIGQEAVQQQQEATKHLWELYYTNLAQLLSGKSTPSEGFQILPNAIELSAIREFGGDMMPLAALKTMMADDYDNMEILAREIMQVTKPGPFRQTNGVRLIDEYKSFLNHVAGVSSVPPLPNPSMLESAQRTLDYEAALNRCTDKYMSASPVFLERFPFDQYTGVFCRDVKMAENAMYAAIGKEQANVGGNPAYAAAVALGMAHGLYTPSTAFKKTQSIRAMEWDCVQAQNDPSIVYRSSPRSFEFQYNHNSWRNTAKSSSFSISVGYGPISVGFSQQKESAQGVDLTAVGGVKASFMDVKYIPLYPGDWYSSTAFKDFRYYPRAAGSPISRYFGETDGTLKLFPKGLYVAVNPTIGFAVQNNKKETFMKSTQQAVNVGASIMGFSLNLGYGKAAKVEEGKENGGKTMINISSQSCQPQLFAVENYYTY